MKTYGVKKLADLSGVSVRTLHHYDKIGLLKPSIRTESKYRLYGEKELLRLQQVLFYKELDFPLQEIREILDDPEFDTLKALNEHKSAIEEKQVRMSVLLQTLENTIQKLKGTIMLNDKDLYNGLPEEKAESYRKGAVSKYGDDQVQLAEKKLKQMSKQELQALKDRQTAVAKALQSLKMHDPESKEVQELIARHYEITRLFWGTAGSEDRQKEAYEGLGSLYEEDERFITSMTGTADPEFAAFLSKAMHVFARQL